MSADDVPSEQLTLSGHALSLAEQAALCSSLPLLASAQNARACFWGKLLGTGADYLIAQTYQETDILATRKAFLSTDSGCTWRMLEIPTREVAQRCRRIRALLTGDPAHEYKLRETLPPELPPPAPANLPVAAEVPPTPAEEADPLGDEEDADVDAEPAEPADAPVAEEPEEGDGEAPPAAPKPPRFRVVSVRELARVAHMVQQIDRACAAVPRGSLFCDEKGAVRVNASFRGVAAADAMVVSAYAHRRAPSHAWAAAAQARGVAVRSLDFLEPLSADVPDGVWALRWDALAGCAVASNLLYEGAHFSLRLSTGAFAQWYVGYGLPTENLCFMV